MRSVGYHFQLLSLACVSAPLLGGCGGPEVGPGPWTKPVDTVSHTVSQSSTAPWRQPYAGTNASGDDVVALWQFDDDAPLADVSGHGHALQLRGEGRIVDEGRFGSGLAGIAASCSKDRPQGAQAALDARLTPAGAFTLEAWFALAPGADAEAATTAMILDNKYYHYESQLPEANHGYAFFLARDRETWIPTAMLGYGADSESFLGSASRLEPGTWHHLAFSYDGHGVGRFYLDGVEGPKTSHAGRAALSPARYGLVVGDRVGSCYVGFPGTLDQVRVSRHALSFHHDRLVTKVAAGQRSVYRRMEGNASLEFVVAAEFGDPSLVLTEVKLELALGPIRKVFVLPDLTSTGSHSLSVPIDTSLRPGSYQLALRTSARANEQSVSEEISHALQIVARPLAGVMPVILWGSGDLDAVAELGFTHSFGPALVDYQAVWDAGAPQPTRVANETAVLDQHLAKGIGVVTDLSPGYWLNYTAPEAIRAAVKRVDRDGRPYDEVGANAALPEAQTFAWNVGASLAQGQSAHPALQALLINTEMADSSSVSFSKYDKDAFSRHAGFPIPSQVSQKTGVRYQDIAGFPSNRVIADEDPILTFYRWFWTVGDGWNPLHSQVDAGIRSTGTELFTFYDPAVRAPNIWGSGGSVDVISQWTYTYPDPLKIAQATDELFAMAEGSSGQGVMKMTQIIWYRSQTAPTLPDRAEDRAAWEQQHPDPETVRFITIAPDQLREAFWSKISRPVRGIMYHGWGSLVPGQTGAYTYTQAETRDVLRELIREVVVPLGPTLLQVPAAPSRVALLQSFASQVFAQRGTWGYSNSWEADAHLVLQYAQLQPRIVFDQSIVDGALDSVDVLVAPNADVLTRSVYSKIVAFRARGGLLVADEHLCPALTADVRLRSVTRSGRADQDKAALQREAGVLREALKKAVARYADSSNPDVVVHARRYRDADYLFAINDSRTFGDYVGHHGLVMEKGLSATATLRVARSGGYVYDLVTHLAQPASVADSALQIPASLGPGGGRLLMITPSKIDALTIAAPAKVTAGETLTVQVAVVDAAGQPIEAIVPLRVQLLDPQGSPAEFSGYYGAKDGRLSLPLDLARNDPAGSWTLQVQELASGKEARRTLTVAQAPAAAGGQTSVDGGAGDGDPERGAGGNESAGGCGGGCATGPCAAGLGGPAWWAAIILSIVIVSRRRERVTARRGGSAPRR
ncbi:MAG: hypothetical protein IPL40_15700 [Proteobacteria bacterium]|nr:hypothetical protein [Pseudomonadota bacterium]